MVRRLSIASIVVVLSFVAYLGMVPSEADPTRGLEAEQPRPLPMSAQTPGPNPRVDVVGFDRHDSADADALLVQVVEGRTGAPCKNTSVGFLDQDQLPDGQTLLDAGLALDFEGRVARFGRTVTTDERGIVFVPTPRARAWLVARTVAGFASVSVTPTVRTVVLTIEDSVRHVVWVRDDEGRAVADVPVLARVAIGSSGPVLWRARTDARGCAVLVDVLTTASALAGRPVEVQVALAVPSRTTAMVSLPAGGGDVTLTLGGTGVLTVVLDSVPDRGFLVRVRAHDGGLVRVASDLVAVGPLLPPCIQEVCTLAGRARFANCASGPLVVEVLDPLGELVPTAVLVDGPAAAAEVEVRVDLREWRPVWRLRLVDDQGLVVAPESLRVRATPIPVALATRGVVDVGLGGEVRLVLPENFIGRKVRGSIVLATDDGAHQATLEIDRVVETGVLALGDVTLREVPVVLAGRMIDDTGEPIPGGRVLISSRSGGLESSVRTLSDGSFRLHAATSEDLVEVVALSERHHGDAGFDLRRTFPRGTNDATLVLRRNGTVTGRLVRADGGSVAGFEVILGDAMDAATLAADGRFGLRSRGSGVVALTVRREGQWIAEIAEIVVNPGTTTRDVRLHPLTISTTLREYAILVRDLEGSALACAEVQIDDPHGMATSLLGDGTGRFTFLAPRDCVTVSVSAPGHRSARQALRPGGSDITLAGGIRLRCDVFIEGLDDLGSFVWLIVRGATTSDAAQRVLLERSGDGRWSANLGLPDLGTYALELERIDESESDAEPRVRVLTLGECSVAADSGVRHEVSVRSADWSRSEEQR